MASLASCRALLVGISNYPYLNWPPAGGAEADLQMMKKYLLENHGVPAQNIQVLENSDATRQQILDTFQSHFIDSPDTNDESSFIFYFSGHGARVEVPEGWPKAHDGENQLEMILPFDVCNGQGNDPPPICGIPDRTLGALLDKLAAKHGTNITVIMDCCHSGHGTREDDFPFSVRSVDSDYVDPPHRDTDRDIWGDQLKGKSILTSASKRQSGLSHVLLSASRKDQPSFGKPGGGFFTRHLIDTLKNGNVKPPTYGRIISEVEIKLNKFLETNWPQENYAQNPQCEGAHDRIIFESTRVDQRSFRIIPDENCHSSITIGAGAPLGVKPGTIFDIYQGNSRTMEPLVKLGTAKATKVEAKQCDADLESDTGFEGDFIVAQIRPNYSLKYAIVDRSEAQSSSRTDQVTLLRNKLAESSDLLTVLQEVKDPDEADVVLEVKGETVKLIHHDRDGQARLGHILPVMLTAHTGHSKVLNGVARFNFFLSHENELQSGVNSSQVDVELHLLAPYDASGIDTGRARSKRVDPQDDTYEFKDASDLSEEPEYAFLLLNNSSTDLYAYLVFYDPQTYKIELVYKPANESEATLPKGGSLQIGGSLEYKDAFAFYLEGGKDQEVGFFRIFFSPDSLQISHLEQSAMVTTSHSNEDGVPVGRSTEDEDEQKEDNGKEAFKVTTASMDKCLALLVGITKYSHFDETPIEGVQADLDKVQNYLLQTLAVPSVNIHRLEESNATRNNIIHAFKDHLIDNPKASDESAFIFYYTGLGAQVPSPEGWPTAHDGENYVEMILPFDVCKPQGDNRRVCGIPDRTLGALLEELARKHGTNITVIMDCCYSGHGTREEDFPPSARTANLDPLLESDTDRDIWGTQSKAESILSSGKRQRGLSHVLLSASRKDQLSFSNKRGGFFTRHLIDTLKNGNVKPPTYGEIVAVVNTKLNEYLETKWPQCNYAQNPQCEGAHDRIIFQRTRVDPRSFRVTPHKNCHPSISIGGAGAPLGVKPGTIFDIYQGNPDTMEPLAKLGTAKATKVEANKCDADLESDTPQLEGGFIVAQIRPNYSLKYAIVDRSRAQSSSRTNQVALVEDNLRNTRDACTALQYVEDESEADVVLEIEGKTVTLSHHDKDDQARLGYILPVRLITHTEHWKVLNGIARFNFFLSLENELESGVISSLVDVELHMLKPYDASGNDTGRDLDKIVHPKDDAYAFEDTSTSFEEPEYAFVLRNRSRTDLYAYIVFYDPQTYKIELVYKPANENDAPLPKDGSLQIGGSPRYKDVFAFYLEEGKEEEVGFFRIFLSPVALNLEPLQQSAVITTSHSNEQSAVTKTSRSNEQSAMITTSHSNEDGLGRSTEDEGEQKDDNGKEVEAFKGEWGCVTRRVVVRKSYE